MVSAATTCANRSFLPATFITKNVVDWICNQRIRFLWEKYLRENFRLTKEKKNSKRVINPASCWIGLFHAVPVEFFNYLGPLFINGFRGTSKRIVKEGSPIIIKKPPKLKQKLILRLQPLLTFIRLSLESRHLRLQLILLRWLLRNNYIQLLREVFPIKLLAWKKIPASKRKNVRKLIQHTFTFFFLFDCRLFQILRTDKFPKNCSQRNLIDNQHNWTYILSSFPSPCFFPAVDRKAARISRISRQ